MQPGSKFSADDLLPMLEAFDAEEWAAGLGDIAGPGGFTCHKVCHLPSCMIAGVCPPLVIRRCVETLARPLRFGRPGTCLCGPGKYSPSAFAITANC